MRYWVESSELWVADDREVAWHDCPDGKPVVQAIGIPNSTDALVLLDAQAEPRTASGILKGGADRSEAELARRTNDTDELPAHGTIPAHPEAP